MNRFRAAARSALAVASIAFIGTAALTPAQAHSAGVLPNTLRYAASEGTGSTGLAAATAPQLSPSALPTVPQRESHPRRR